MKMKMKMRTRTRTRIGNDLKARKNCSSCSLRFHAVVLMLQNGGQNGAFTRDSTAALCWLRYVYRRIIVVGMLVVFDFRNFLHRCF